VLLQVMEDEFSSVVEDGSEQAVAAALLRSRQECLVGNFDGVRRLESQWKAARGAKVTSVRAGGDDQDDDDDEDDSEDGDEDEEGDVRMGEDDEAPQLVETRRPEPEVDEDGFTKVASRRRR
jgi:pre-rRNA-processing protein TSR2